MQQEVPPSRHLRPETHGLKAPKYDAPRSRWTSQQTCLKAFLTLIATMHSMVLSFRTQEMAGATTSSRLHFWYSASDLRHHLILAEGAAEAAAVKSRQRSCSAFRAKHKPACVSVRTEAPEQHREEESLHAGCPGVQVSRADRAGGGRGFYSTPQPPQRLLWFPNVCASPEMDEKQTDKPAGWKFPNQPTTVCANLKSATKVDVMQVGRRQTPSFGRFSDLIFGFNRAQMVCSLRAFPLIIFKSQSLKPWASRH